MHDDREMSERIVDARKVLAELLRGAARDPKPADEARTMVEEFFGDLTPDERVQSQELIDAFFEAMRGHGPKKVTDAMAHALLAFIDRMEAMEPVPSAEETKFHVDTERKIAEERQCAATGTRAFLARLSESLRTIPTHLGLDERQTSIAIDGVGSLFYRYVCLGLGMEVYPTTMAIEPNGDVTIDGVVVIPVQTAVFAIARSLEIVERPFGLDTATRWYDWIRDVSRVAPRVFEEFRTGAVADGRIMLTRLTLEESNRDPWFIDRD